jgi:hypothetical protein
MRVTLEQVSQGAVGVWTSVINPQNLLRLGNPIRQGGKVNIVLVSKPSFDNKNNSLQFDLDSTILLNLGNTSEAILVDSRENALQQPHGLIATTKKQSDGDVHFLAELKQLPDSQKKVGETILSEIRKEYPGELIFHEKSGKFVESPDNFWVVRVQPRAKSLRIVVYGSPQEHGSHNSIELKDDMAGYSSFVIDSQDQVREAVTVISNAKRLKDAR